MKNKPEIIELFEDIYRLPSIAETIEPREKILLTAYCNELKNVDIHPAILILNPDYNFPAGCVTDDQKIEYFKSRNYEYQRADFVLNAIHPPKPKPATKQPETGLIWNIKAHQMVALHEQLKAPENGFIHPDTTFDDFFCIFDNAPMENKIIWLPRTMNKNESEHYPNKMALVELFHELRNRKLVEFKNADLLKWLPMKFKPFEGEFTVFKSNNQPTDKSSSTHNKRLNEIIVKVKNMNISD